MSEGTCRERGGRRGGGQSNPSRGVSSGPASSGVRRIRLKLPRLVRTLRNSRKTPWLLIGCLTDIGLAQA